jgi:hypothetical protein
MACEKCWGDAYIRHMNNPQKSQAEHYVDLLEERRHAPCTPEQERGQFGKEISEADDGSTTEED